MSAHAALHATEGPCALLESTTGAGPLARLSLLARHPRCWLTAGRNWARIGDARGEQLIACEPLELLRELLREGPAGAWPHEPAVVGALAYDWARPSHGHDDATLLVALVVPRLELFEVQTAPAGAWSPASGASIELERHSSLSRAAYHRLVRRVQAHIAAGDVYQVNLSQRFDLPFDGDGLALYDELRSVSPAPFSGYLRVPGFTLVSASPERLVSVLGREIATRPIAGTRPRARERERDLALAHDLLSSEKERAEP